MEQQHLTFNESVVSSSKNQNSDKKIQKEIAHKILFLHAEMTRNILHVEEENADGVIHYTLNASSGSNQSSRNTYAKFEILKNYLSEKSRTDDVVFYTQTIPQQKISSMVSWKIFKKCYAESMRVVHQKYTRQGVNFEYVFDYEAHKSGYVHNHCLLVFASGKTKETKEKVANEIRNVFQEKVNALFMEKSITKYQNDFSSDIKFANKEGVINYITKEVAKYRNIERIYEDESYKNSFDKILRMYEKFEQKKEGLSAEDFKETLFEVRNLVRSEIEKMLSKREFNEYEIKTIQTHFHLKSLGMRAYEMSRGLQEIIKIFHGSNGKVEVQKVKDFNKEYDIQKSFEENLNLMYCREAFGGSASLDNTRDNSHKNKYVISRNQFEEFEKEEIWAESLSLALEEYHFRKLNKQIEFLQSLQDGTVIGKFSEEKYDCRKVNTPRNYVYHAVKKMYS